METWSARACAAALFSRSLETRSSASGLRTTLSVRRVTDSLTSLPSRTVLPWVNALEHEGRIGPRAIELGDVHAELQLSHRHLFPLHRLILAARTPRRARRGSPRRAQSPHR